MVVNYFGRQIELPAGHYAVCTDADGGVYSSADVQPSYNKVTGTWCSPLFNPFELIDTRDDLDAEKSFVCYKPRNG